jgi:hypothetical protein
MRFDRLLLGGLAAAPALLLATPAAAQPQTIEGNIQVCETARGEHRIQLEQGRRYTITARSDAFDTVLRVLRPGNETPIAENDDYGDGLNSRVTVVAPETGEYIARIGSFSPGGVGAYQLRVEPAAPLPALLSRPTRTERGQARLYEGELTANDPAEDSRHYDDYELRLAANQAAMIHLDGQGADVMLRVYAADARGGTALAEDDDGGGGLNSFIFFAPPEAGTYVVRVTTFGENATGRYRLRVAEQAYTQPTGLTMESPAEQ